MASPAGAVAPPPVPSATIEWVVAQLRAVRTSTNEQRAAITAQLTATGKSPQFNQFLVQILCTNPSPLEEAIRQLAGLLLKQNARHFVAWPASTQAMIKTTLLGALGLPQRHLRRTVAVAVTTIVSFIRLVGWKELLPAIAESLAPTVSAAAMDGAMYTATVLCEDFPTDMNSAELGWPLTVLIPKFIMFFKHPTPAFRRMALRCLLNFIFDMPSAMVTNMPTYLAGLSALTTDTDGDVRKYVCQSLVCLVEDRLDLLMPHIRPIIAFMIHSMLDENDEIQLAACEFWCPFIDAAENHAGILIEHFPKLIPAIWHCLRYSEEELADLPVDDVADEAIADREEDIQPFIYNRHKEGGGDASRWTVRKCAGYTLDRMAVVFGEKLLAAVLPGLNQRFTSQDDALWLDREAGIVAFGAVVSGCMENFKPCFPALFPRLLSLTDNKRPLLRGISCWALSQIADWVVEQPDKKTYTFSLLNKLCTHVLDHNKFVQESACSAFSVLAERAGQELVPFLIPILDTLSAAFAKYQAKNVFILYDALGTFCDAMGPGVLNHPAVVSKILAPITTKWNALRDDDRGLLPLLECMTSVARGLGPSFVTSAPTVFKRCLTLLESNLVAIKAAEDAAEEIDSAELDGLRDFIILALDMMSAMAEALGAGVGKLFTGSNMMPLLHECITDANPAVRQSACGLVGDIATTCPEFLAPVLQDILGKLVLNLLPKFEYVCSNASWAIGEIAMRAREKMQPFAPVIATKLSGIICSASANSALLENVSISMARLAIVCPAQVSPLLPAFAAPFLTALRVVSDPKERVNAFQGLMELLKVNSGAVAPHFAKLCDAMVAWENPPAEMATLFRHVVGAFRTLFGASWVTEVAKLHPATRTQMAAQYGMA